MNIKCNATHCKNFKHSKCTLKDIELEFNWDYEGYGCCCSNFRESKEYKQQYYKIVPYKDVFVIIQTNCIETPINYISEIITDIKQGYLYRNEITLIFDTLLAKYSARADDRFLKANYYCDKVDVDKWEFLDNSINSKFLKPIFKITCDYLRNEYQLSEDLNGHGFIKDSTARMILKGMNI